MNMVYMKHEVVELMLKLVSLLHIVNCSYDVAIVVLILYR